MFSQVLWLIIESSINVMEVLVDAYFLTHMFPKKYGKNTTVVANGIFIAVYNVYLFYATPHLSNTVEFLCQIALMLAFVILFRRGHFGWKVFIVIIMNSVFAAVNVGSRMAFSLVLGPRFTALMSLTGFRYVWIAIYHTIYFAVLWWIMHVKDATSLKIPANNYLMIVFPLYSLVLLILLDFIIYLNPGAGWERACMIIAFGTLFLDAAVMVIFMQNSRKHEELRQLRSMKSFSDQQERHIEALIRNYEDIKTWRHDIKHQLCAIGAALDLGEYGKAKEHIEQSLDGTNAVLQNYAATGNIMVDALIAFKKSDAGHNGIDMTVDMILPATTTVSDFDLCRMLGNLIDNAIEACLLIKDGREKFIKIEAVPQNANLFIKITNSTSGIEKRVNNVFKSVKDKKHHEGLGLKSVDKIVASAKGYWEMSHENNVFKTTILLPCILIADLNYKRAS